MISGSILLIFAIGISVLLLITVVFAVTVYSAPDKLTKEVSLSCHDRILGYARMGAFEKVLFGQSCDSFDLIIMQTLFIVVIVQL
jgi:hypothetical protein